MAIDKTAVFVLQHLEALHHGGVHATVLGTPFIERGTAHAVLTSQLRDRHAILDLFENRQDLTVGKT